MQPVSQDGQKRFVRRSLDLDAMLGCRAGVMDAMHLGTA
jgi:hypothetical protein